MAPSQEEEDDGQEVTDNATLKGWYTDEALKGINSLWEFTRLREEQYPSPQRTCTNQGPVPRRYGIQLSPTSLDTVMKSWRAIFTTSILKIIIEQTKEYGNMVDKKWKDLNENDLLVFLQYYG